MKTASYGYSQIVVDIDNYLNVGENILHVVADNTNQPDSRWYTGAGIYRPVYLYLMPCEHILFQGVQIDTVTVDNPAVVQMEIAHTKGIKNIVVDILDKEDKVVRHKDVEVEADKTKTGIEIIIPDAKLWSADQPYLYRARISAFSAGDNEQETTEDVVEERFGIRRLEWSKRGFFVNGKSEKLKGGCVHHDNGILGARADKYAERRRVRKLKEAGFNAIRSSHNPCSKAMLEACDEYGMYVIDELWDMWYKHKSKYDYASEFLDYYQDDVIQLVSRDYNHPSVIMYSIGNEVSEPASQKGIDLSQKIVQQIHDLDSSRAVTAGYNLMIITQSADGKDMYDEKEGGRDNKDSKQTKEMNSTLFNMIAMMVGTGMNKAANSKKADKATTPALDILDIAGYNYASGRYPLEGKAHPDRIIFGSETFPQDIVKNWEMVEKYPYLIGDFMWTSWDYLGEAGLGTWSYYEDAKGFDKPYPWLISGSGAFDIIGNSNGALYLAQAVWNEDMNPIIGVQPCNCPGKKLIKSVWRGTNAISSWSWSGCEGNRVVIEVFSKAPTVELFLNGQSLGKRKPKNCVAKFKTKYTPGVLKALAYDDDDGNEIGQSQLKTAEKELHISIVPENDVIKAGETIFAQINIADKNGEIESNKDEKISVEVEGGKLLGFGSANPRTEESFVAGSYTSFYGRTLACIKVGSEGVLTIKASGDNLQQEQVNISISNN